MQIVNYLVKAVLFIMARVFVLGELFIVCQLCRKVKRQYLILLVVFILNNYKALTY